MDIYLDNSATTRVSPAAAAMAMKMMTDCYGNPSSLHRKGFEAEQAVTAARNQVAAVLGVDRDEIVFTSCGSEANNLALLGSVRAKRRSGSKIITTATEHASVLGAVSALEKEGFTVVRLAPEGDGTVSSEAVAEAVDSETILVSIMQVNSETGSINDIPAIVEAIRRRNRETLIHCDCVQSFCKLPVTPRRWGVDMVTVSGHKIHAPKGGAALYRRKGVRLLPFYYGSAQEGGLHSGTENTPSICAMGLAAEQMWGSRRENEAVYRTLHDRLAENISQLPELCINSPAKGAPYITNISAVGVRSEVMIHYMEQFGIYLSSGSACSKGAKSHVLTAMRLSPERIDSAIRISLCPQNTVEELDILTQKLADGCRTLAQNRKINRQE